MKKYLVLFLTVALTTLVPLSSMAAPQPQTGASQAAGATLNINTASSAELQGLPGIGKVTADNIVAYRTDKGKFKTTDDLLKVKGIGPKTYEKIKTLVSVN